MSLGSTVGGALLALVSSVGALGAPVDAARSPDAVAPVGDARRAAGPAGPAGAQRPRDAWTWPFAPRPEVVRRFDPPDKPWLPGHRGVDLRAAPGQGVLAPAPGTVTYAGRLAGRGVVVVTHAAGLHSTFEPVGSAPAVGTVVARGDRVGVVTSEPGHCAPRTCVHWGVLRGRSYLDPLALLGQGPVVLLPLA